MKIFILLLSLFFSTHFVFGNDDNGTKINSTIKEVTVYLNGARIKRTAVVNLKAGKNELILNKLATIIDESSIQVAGLKNANVLSINYEIDYLEKKETSLKIKNLTTQKEDLLQQQDRLQNQLEGYDKELKVLDYNLRVNSDQTDLSLERLKQVATYHRERTNTILDKKYTLKKEVKELTNKLSKLQNEINKFKGDSTEVHGQIKIKLDAPIATNINLKVSYNVSKAGWFPEYDLKSNNIQSDLNIVYKANVYQQTGISWKDIAITLSTGDPSLDNNKPNLNSKYLSFLQETWRLKNNSQLSQKNLVGSVSKVRAEDVEEMVTSSLSEALRGRVAGVKTEETSSIPREQKKTYNKTVDAKQEGITNTTFKIKKKYTIDSNSESTAIEIDKFPLPTKYSYYVAPELNKNVFLTATLSNWEQFDLLTGEANIYFEGSYVGKALIEPNSTKEKLVLSLGVDPNIVVDRKEPKNFKSKSFTGGTRIVKKTFEISVKNNKSHGVNLVIEERVPISNNKEIKVEDVVTEGANYDSKKGIAKWSTTVPSKQLIQKKLSYTIKYPKGKRINL